jgi:acetyl-CoA synthetase
VITADYAPRGGRKTPLKSNVDAALLNVLHDGQGAGGQAHRRPDHLDDGRDYDYNELRLEADDHCPVPPR